MFWFIFWFNRGNEGQDNGSSSRTSFSGIVCAYSILLTLLLVLLLAVVFGLISFFFPRTGSFEDFYPTGSINCYLSGVSETDGYHVLLITEEDATILTTPVTEKRYREMKYLHETEPATTCYCLNTYKTGTGDDFISTYEDQTTEEVWQDYCAAVRDGSLHKNLAVIVVLFIPLVLSLLFFILLLRALIREIRNHRSGKALEASILNQQEEKTEKESTVSLPLLPGETPPEKASDPTLPKKDDLSEEIDNFDPGNASWHK